MQSEAYLHPVHKDLCSEKNETMVDSFKSLIQTKIVLILLYNRNNRTVIPANAVTIKMICDR